jgi:hypothetical protein
MIEFELVFTDLHIVPLVYICYHRASVRDCGLWIISLLDNPRPEIASLGLDFYSPFPLLCPCHVFWAKINSALVRAFRALVCFFPLCSAFTLIPFFSTMFSHSVW